MAAATCAHAGHRTGIDMADETTLVYAKGPQRWARFECPGCGATVKARVRTGRTAKGKPNGFYSAVVPNHATKA